MNKLLGYVLVTVAVGILLGIFTSFGQTFIPAPLIQLVNSYSMWLLFSFVVGLIIKSYKLSTIALAGVVVQYLAILFYYIASAIRFDMPFTPASLISLNLVWIVGGTLVGPIASTAGAMVARKTKYMSAAIGFMGGLIFSESIYQFIKLGYIAEGVVFLTVGLAFLGVMYYKLKYELPKTLLITVLFSIFMFAGYAYVLGSLFP